MERCRDRFGLPSPADKESMSDSCGGPISPSVKKPPRLGINLGVETTDPVSPRLTLDQLEDKTGTSRIEAQPPELWPF